MNSLHTEPDRVNYDYECSDDDYSYNDDDYSYNDDDNDEEGVLTWNYKQLII